MWISKRKYKELEARVAALEEKLRRPTEKEIKAALDEGVKKARFKASYPSA